MAALPIEPILPALGQALAAAGRAVLQAPPGAGKTTRVPLYLLETGLVTGRIVMLEPRRVAARAAAERLAAGLGEPVGRRVGYRIRGEAVAGSRIEVVTEGILTRMLQSDPDLPGTGCLIFDEFHERSLQADLGLALALEVRAALRPDLRLLVMSATLDAGPVAALMDDAPILTAEGRAWPVETRWLDRPLGPGARLEPAVAELTLAALAETEGGVLVFLPGQAEIARTAARLAPHLPPGVVLQPLHGGLPFAEQRAALQPLPQGRRLVLATAIAETSLTIPDVRVVVDAGRARRARFDPGSGMTRLVTERVTRAEAEQRRGRAGRTAPGWCYRLWTRGEEGALAAFPPPEIASADLAGFALDLAVWGAATPDGLAFLTPPPAPGLRRGPRASRRSRGARRSGAHHRPRPRPRGAAAPSPPRPHARHRGGAGRRPARRRPRRPRRGARPAPRPGPPPAGRPRPPPRRPARARPGRRPRRRRHDPHRGQAPAHPRPRRAAARASPPAPRCRSPIPTASASAAPAPSRATCSPAARARRCRSTIRSPLHP